MSFPDYEQRTDDHKSLLILVKAINGSKSSAQLSAKVFNKLYEKIANLDELCIEDAQGMGCQRLIRLRFKRNEYENENNDWGDFQCHRKLLGLIAIGKYNGDIRELQEIYNHYQTVVEKYSSTLYDSRCILFNIKPASDEQPQNACSLETNGDTAVKSSASTNSSSASPCFNQSNDVDSQSGDERVTNNYSRTLCNEKDHPLANDITNSCLENKLQKNLPQCLIYNCVNNDIDINLFVDKLEKDVRDLISSLFWVLESKRLDRSYEKQDKIPLLMAPFETKALVGLDMDSKVFRKKCLGRMRKYMGDLSLLAGLPSEALINYGNSIDILRSANDWLWLASALEGQCVASLSLLFPQTSRRKSSLQRNSSLPPSKFRQLQEEAQNPNKSRNVGRKFILPNARSSRSLPNGDPIVAKALGKFLLSSVNEVYEKYKEACCHYAKYRNASVIELECSFKAARMLTFHEKYLYASEFIQNSVFICFNQSHDEQIKRLSVIAELYSDIGYHRKAAFYKRFAALKAVSINVNQPNWEQCYNLLLPSLEGYQLTLDPIEYDRRIKEHNFGWTGIHLQLLQELVTTAKRMNCEQISMRHLSFLLHSLFEFLTPNQRRDFAKQLETLSTNCGEGAPVPLTLENGIIIPSVNLTKFPLVTSFKVQNLSPQTRPIKLKAKHRESVSSSPFIFTPLQFSRPSSARRKSLNSPTSKTLDFKWAEGENCQVLLQVYNYLPIELHVSHMSLMTDGIAFETYPTSLTLPPESGPFPVQLTGTPRASGKLDILGYTTHVLGVKNNCKLKDLTNAKKMKFPHIYTIEVVPHLPLLEIACNQLLKANHNLKSLNSDSLAIASSVNISLFAGESKTFAVTVTNKSVNNELIEILSISLQTKLTKEAEKALINWDEEVIQNNLPLPPNESFNFEITVHGVSDFVHKIQKRKLSSSQLRPRKSSGTSTPMQHSNYSSPLHHAKRNQQNLLGTALANFISDLQNGSNSSSSTKSKQVVSEQAIVSSLDEFMAKNIEVILNIEYSGGSGLAAGYCRKCALVVNIEVLPSILITQWDVLPAEM
ncbi:trafficking protein particle complex subunit 9-like isoform X1 [Dinothrombium tinctorium]|uniref:Trafficking protein particle complex subunit 9-like isoform X1 n=1 Tax=Dinothrombium tinctorium TaxID=1965070 RepID=A0A3S3PAU3_9ACAR|nr:trafficking protein particle complex subunit 9-like isoform X1 [Dinothrombium tinctorium]RWS11564.1 trafficking protein particle complex subunit 9-like isoform X1 [Dinothrombium tinctorium]RWS11604.1 trafficking protein particle complex subunit 9-like isoform X1 [Dinothrombium tinctorium]